MAEPVWVGLLHAGSEAMMTKERAQSRRSHTGATSGSFQRNKHSVVGSLRPFEPQIVVKEFNVASGASGKNRSLVAFATYTDLRFR